MLQKLKTPFLITGFLLVIVIIVAMASLIFKSEDKSKTVGKPKSSLQPQTKFEDKPKDIKIDYSPGTNSYWVYIDAATTKEYIEKRKLAVEELKKIDVDACDYQKTFWTTPTNLKGKFTEDEFNTIRNITCPK